MVQISRLDIAGFRGIPPSVATLNFEKKSVLLFGENGTGKSSFVDAIEKLLCGRVATLDGRAQGICSDRHGPHIRAGVSGPSISITFANPEFVFSLTSQASGFPAALVAYLKAAKEDLFILRRRDILNFIDSLPRDRYAYLRPFLPLAGLQEVENALKEAKDTSSRDVEMRRAEVAQHADMISRPLGIVGEPTKASLVNAIGKLLGEIGRRPVGSMEEVSDALRLLDQQLAKFGDTAIAGRILGAIATLRDLIEAISPESFERLINACRLLREKEAAEAKVFYDRVLEDGIKWIREEERTACPLCEQPIDSAATVANAQARLDSMRELIALRTQASTSLNQATASLRAMKDSAARAKKSLETIQLTGSNITPLPIDQFLAAFASLEREITKGPRLLDLGILEHSIGPLGAESPGKLSILEILTGLQRLFDALPSPDTAKQLLSVQDRISRAFETWNRFESAKALHKAAEAEAGQAGIVYERALEARKEVVQEHFDELSAEIGRYYNRLHPDESHGGIRLEVREAGQASANLRCSFYERTDEDPRGYYSDAHLDTLGISIFLALRKWHRKRYPQFNLLVLDDVLTSIDNAHAVKLSELLLEEFADYQVFLTTHDRIWFEHFQDIQAGCRVSANYVNKVIHNWTIADGPDLREPKEERERLRELLRDGSPEEIASMAGRLFEHTLQEMRYSLRLSVRAKRSERYEIGELWPAFYKKMREDYTTFYAGTKSTLESLNLNWPIRNWIGGHSNDWAKLAPRADAVKFGEAVVGLFDAVFCHRCRKFIAPSSAPIGQLSCPRGELAYPAPGREEAVLIDRAELAKQSDAALRDAIFDTNLYFEQKRAERSREQ
jgi:energy-coupling factor transporter ATP-binding protein EcfA2